MSAKPKHDITPAEYLLLEDAAEFKSEYYNGEMFAMAGASRWHNRVKDNLIVRLNTFFADGPCESFSSDQRVKIAATGLYTYPDIVILCEPFESDPASSITLTNPSILLEVLSHSTEEYDRGTKFEHYRTIPSLKEYVLVAQDRPCVDRFTRLPDDTWSLTTVSGLDAVFTLESIPVRIPLQQLYIKVEFPPQPLVLTDTPRRPG